MKPLLKNVRGCINKPVTAVILFCAILLPIQAGAAPTTYWIGFSDKSNNRYTLSDPAAFLSQKSIERRQLQGIALTEEDLPVSPAYVEAVRELGCEIRYSIKWFNGVLVSLSDESQAASIEKLSFVREVKRLVSDTERKPVRRDKFPEVYPLSADEFAPSTLKSSRYDYGQAERQISMMKGHVLHEKGYDGKGVIIAVIDGGFTNADKMFKNLWDSNRILGTYDFVDSGPMSFSKSNHGTNVLSTIGAEESGKIVGTAPQASFYLLRTEAGDFEDIVEEYHWVKAAEYADSVGAHVINSSLGYSEFDDASQNHTYQDMDGNTTPAAKGADIAASKGILICISAGNSGADPWKYITTPADADSVVCVGAVDRNGNYAYFSSIGPSSDGDVKPSVVAMGVSSTVLTPNNSVGTSNGTSFSSPIAAGSFACLRQAFPTASNMIIIEKVQESASLAQNPTDKLGYGLPDFEKAFELLNQTGIKTPVVSDALKTNHFTVRHIGDKTFVIEAKQKSSAAVNVDLFTMQGKKVFATTISNITEEAMVTVPALSKGMYIFQIRSNAMSVPQKIYLH